MSKLRIYGKDTESFELNITQFRSPMSATINSSQVRSMHHHFAIRCGQPDINFTVHYESLDIKHSFEAFVREHQLAAQEKGSDGKVTLWWPERNIRYWTGFITKYAVSEKRYEQAPSATFGVSLIDSLMSEETTLATRGIDLSRILGIKIPEYGGYRDLIVIRPTSDGVSVVNPQDLPGAPPGPTPTGPGPTYPQTGGGSGSAP